MSSAEIYKKVSSCAELEAALSAFSSEVVYRGQTKHHVDANGHLSMTTSFAREGCAPPLMLKWSQYANSVILALQGQRDRWRRKDERRRSCSTTGGDPFMLMRAQIRLSQRGLHPTNSQAI
jgi:hypothetical protein